MKKIILGTLLLGLISSPAFGKGKPQGGKDNKVEKSHFKDDKDKDHKRDHDRDKDKDHKWGKDHDKDRDHRASSDRPAGWDKGKKTGWGNCDVPPGQAKKVGCHPNGRRRVVAHRDTRTNPKPTASRPYPTRTTTGTPTTTTTTTTTTAKKGTHPFDPTLRRKQTEEQQRKLAQTK